MTIQTFTGTGAPDEYAVYTLNAAIDFFGPKEIRLRPTPTQQENGLWQVKMRCWL